MPSESSAPDSLARLIAEQVADRLRHDFARISPWFTPEDAASYLRLTKRGLEDLRARDAGPRFHRAGGRVIRYHRQDLDAWLLRDGGGRGE